MKITDLRCFLVRKNLLLVKIETDAGVCGWGKPGPSAWRREMGVQGIIAHFRESLVGKDPMNITALWQEMFRVGPITIKMQAISERRSCHFRTASAFLAWVWNQKIIFTP